MVLGRKGNRAAAKPTGRERVVILGGGFAGATTALAIKRLLPRVEVTVVEQGPAFVAAPRTLDYLFGIAAWGDVTRGYEALTSRGIRLHRGEVEGIEPERQVVRTTGGTVPYTFVVVATGIRLADEEVARLAEHPEANASLYDRSRLPELHRRVSSYRGGTIVLSVPPPPLQCPPAPYEFALLLAGEIRRKQLNGKIVLLDASTAPQPPPLSAGVEAALDQSEDVIEYVRSARVTAVDPGAGKVLTADRETFSYDLLSLIPPHRAARFIQESGLAQPGDPFVEVDPFTFRSPKFETVYAVGDAARTPYARTASAAVVTAMICAQQIAKALGVTTTPTTAFQSLCIRT